MPDTQKRYRAFISYSQQDSAWGKRLHTWLETYRVPVGVIAGVNETRRLGRFFRDDEEMSAASDIAVIVRKAIDTADSLIVICSPRSAKSQWVNAEIQHFRRTGRGDRVFAFIIDGQPNSGDPETECFPPALRASGDPDHPDALPIEPLGLDVRKDGKARACARLAAGLLHVDFDDLWQRDRRRMREIYAAVAIAAVIGSVLLGVALKTGFEAQAASMRRQLAVSLPEQAELQMNTGRFDLAARYALASLRLAPENPGPAQDVLRAAMQQAGGGLLTSPNTMDMNAEIVIGGDQSVLMRRGKSGMAEIVATANNRVTPIKLRRDRIIAATFSPDGARLLALEKARVSVWDAATGNLQAAIDTPGEFVVKGSFSPDGSWVFTEELFSLSIWDAADGGLIDKLDAPPEQGQSASSPDGALTLEAEGDHAEVRKADGGKLAATLAIAPSEFASAAFSPDGARIVTAGHDHTAKVWNVADGRLLATLSGHRDGLLRVAFSADGSKIATGSVDGSVKLWTAANGKEIATLDAKGGPVGGLAFSPDGAHLVSAGTDGIANIWETSGGKLLGSIGDRSGSMTGATFSSDGMAVLLHTSTGLELWDVAWLVQPAKVLQHDACADFLGEGGRRFTEDELAADGRLRGVWPDAARDVCEGVPDLPPLPPRKAPKAGVRGADAFGDALMLCKGGKVANAPPVDAKGAVRNYAKLVDVQGVTLAVNPTRGACLSAGFGKRGDVLHKGIDFIYADEAPILAAGAGTIVERAYRPDYGNMVLIDHGHGVFTRYAHLESFNPDLPLLAHAEAGQEIGRIGASAGFASPIHLHYEVLVGDYAGPKKSFGLAPKSPFSFPAAR